MYENEKGPERGGAKKERVQTSRDSAPKHAEELRSTAEGTRRTGPSLPELAIYSTVPVHYHNARNY
jgi:hypothetical protein